jgi:mRNA export factor
MWSLGQQLTTPNAVPQQIGAHTTAVKSVGLIKSSNLIVSGGYDKKLNFWDARSPNPAWSIDLPERCYDIDVQENLMVVATAEKHVLVYDVSGQPREHMRKISPLKYQTRCVRCFPDMSGFAIGSIEGRVGIQYNNKAQEGKNFSFKCHRQNQDVYAVNAIAFHPIGIFATVGSDGAITFWDKDNKQKLKGFAAVGKPIPCANFNAQGNLFAYAKSYDWSKGSTHYAPGTPNEIMIHYTTEEEVKPKPRRK